MNQHARDNDHIDIDLESAIAKGRSYSTAGLAGSAADRMAELTGRPWKHVFDPPSPGVVKFRIQEATK
jgi:hypothetical protein